MSPAVDSVPDDGVPPLKVDVVIVGGGVIGVSAAYFMCCQGLKVAVVEKGRIAGEQSSRNWGWCRQQGRDERELPLARESLRIWHRLQSELSDDLGFRPRGVAYLTESEDELSRWVAWTEMARRYDVDSHVLSSRQALAMTPGCSRHWLGGIHTPSDGRAEPSAAVPALARHVRQRGGTIHQNCAARGFETHAGRVATVITEKGEIRTDSVVCAAGAWSSLFCRRHDLRLPQLAVRSSVARAEATQEITDGAVGSSAFCIRKRLDGGYSVALRQRNILDLTPDAFRYFRAFLPAYRHEGGQMKIRFNRRFVEAWRRSHSWPLDRTSPFERVRVLDPEPDRPTLDVVMTNLRDAYPGIEQMKITHTWAGMIDVTPDALPVISPVDAYPGLVLATGFSGHGFGIGPAAGQLVANLISGESPIVDPHPFRYGRMVDGSRLIPDSL